MILLIIFNNCDLFAMSETWTRDAISISNFRCFNQPANKKNLKKSGRNSGGIMLFYEESLAKNISFMKSNHYYICCKIDKKLFDLTKDVFVCAVYILPENSNYYYYYYLFIIYLLIFLRLQNWCKK